MTISKIFKVANIHEYYPTKKLYLNDNSRTSSFKAEETDVGDQDENG